MIRKTMLALTMVAAVAACGDDDSSGPDPSESAFSIQVRGDLQENVTGKAWFGTDVNDDGEPVWALVLGEDDSRHFVVVGRDGTARPNPGTYPILDPESEQSGWTLIHIVSDGEELEGLFYGVDGTLTITESSSDVVKGSIEFDAEGLIGLEEGDIEVTGTFTAMRVTQIPGVAAAGSR